jgi:trigger factor
LKITTEDMGNRQVRLTIEVDQERVEQAMRGVARQISKEYKIPGFRRGRAPFGVIVQRFGRETLLREALDDLAQEVVPEALVEEDLEVYDVGTLEDVQLEPLTLQLVVPLRPKVELGDYRELRVDPPEVRVDEEEVDAELEKLRDANAVLEPADDHPAKLGDWVSLDVRATLEDEELLDRTDYTMVLNAGDEEFEEGFAGQVAGMQAGEEKQFALTLGDDWGEDQAGKEATFEVTVHEIRNRIVPPLDDDLARTIGDFDTLEELRQNIREQFEADEQLEADQAYSNQVIEALVDRAELEYPPQMLEDQVGDMVEDLEERLKPQGIAIDDYLKLTGQTEEQFRESLQPRAEEILERGLVLGALASAEGLDVEGHEVDAQIALMSANWGGSADEAREVLSSSENVRTIASNLLTNKVVRRLVAIARGEAPPLEEAEEPSDEEAEARAGDVVESAQEQPEAAAPEEDTATATYEETPEAEEASPSDTV